jgi:hypothetical protein
VEIRNQNLEIRNKAANSEPQKLAGKSRPRFPAARAASFEFSGLSEIASICFEIRNSGFEFSHPYSA